MADDRYFTELVSGKREAGDALDRAMAQGASEEEDSFIDILDLQGEDAAEEDESLGAAMRQWRSVLDHMIHGASSYDSATGESTRVHGKRVLMSTGTGTAASRSRGRFSKRS